MDFLALKDIAERDLELINPSSGEKIVRAGKHLGLQPGARVIDYGCGFAEPLTLWAEAYGISGVGIDIRPYACERARAKIQAKGQSDRIEIVCGPGAAYPVADHSFDHGVCIGASFVFGGFRPTVQALRRVTKPGNRIAIGEPYWRHTQAPADLVLRYRFHTERELLKIASEEGYYIEWIVRSTEEDWDNYQCANWSGLIRWLADNPGHPEWKEVQNALSEDQQNYLGFEREFYSWAIYVLAPKTLPL